MDVLLCRQAQSLEHVGKPRSSSLEKIMNQSSLVLATYGPMESYFMSFGQKVEFHMNPLAIKRYLSHLLCYKIRIYLFQQVICSFMQSCFFRLLWQLLAVPHPLTSPHRLSMHQHLSWTWWKTVGPSHQLIVQPSKPLWKFWRGWFRNCVRIRQSLHPQHQVGIKYSFWLTKSVYFLKLKTQRPIWWVHLIILNLCIFNS